MSTCLPPVKKARYQVNLRVVGGGGGRKCNPTKKGRGGGKENVTQQKKELIAKTPTEK